MQHAILEGGVVRWGMRAPPLGEAASTTAAAQLARTKPHDKDVPVAAFVDDLERKVKLRKVMGRPSKNKFKRTGLSEQELAPDDHSDPDDDELDDLYKPPDNQFSKEDVNYRYSGKPDFSCGVCRYFIEPGACQIVNGLIRPVDVCDKFEPKGAGNAPAAGARAVLAEVLVEAQVAEHTQDPSGKWIPSPGEDKELRQIQLRRQAAKDTARDMNAEVEAEIAEHKQDPSGKWVPTPGEGGAGAGPSQPRKHAKVKDPRASDSGQARREMRDPVYRNKLGFVDDISRRHGDAVADQAAGILGMPEERDRFYDRWAPKKPRRMSDMNSNALKIIRDEARSRGYGKLAGAIDRYLGKRKRGTLSEADISGDFGEQGAPAYPTSGGLNLGALGPLVRAQSVPLPGGGMNREAVVFKKALTQFRRDAGGRIAAIKAAYREVSPPGWEGTVKRMKRHPEITNPWALAWYMKGKGHTPGYGPRGGKKKTALRTVTAEVV